MAFAFEVAEAACDAPVEGHDDDDGDDNGDDDDVADDNDQGW